MNRRSAMTVMIVLVTGISACGMASAAEDAGHLLQQGKVSASSVSPQAPASPVASPAKPVKPNNMMILTGEIVLREPDQKQPSTAYLRVRDASDRVWLVAITPATEVTKKNAKVSAELLTVGTKVQTQIPRGLESIPLSESIAIVE